MLPLYSPQNFAPPVGGADPHLTRRFLGKLEPITPSSISIKSVVFPKYMVVTNGQTDRMNIELDLYRHTAYAISATAMWPNNTNIAMKLAFKFMMCQ